LHAVYHVVETREGGSRVLAGEGSIGGGFEGGENVLVFALDMPLDCLEVFTGEFMRKSKERLVLDARSVELSVYEKSCANIPTASGSPH